MKRIILLLISGFLLAACKLVVNVYSTVKEVKPEQTEQPEQSLKQVLPYKQPIQWQPANRIIFTVYGCRTSGFKILPKDSIKNTQKDSTIQIKQNFWLIPIDSLIH